MSNSVVNAIRPFARSKLVITGTVILLVVAVIALLAPLLVDGDANQIRPRQKNLTPSWEHPFGTDALGRDLFLRIAKGAQYSLGIGAIIAAISAVIGSTLGLLAGYWGGWVDSLISRIVDALMAFPSVLLALGLIAMVGGSFTGMILALSLVYIPRVARVARAPVLVEKRLEYVEAARSCGVSHARIMFRHILPNVLSPVIVQVTVIFAYAIIAEATLGFLGVGVPPPEPTWGNILAETRRTLMTIPMQTAYPSIALGLTVLGINLLGDGLRDMLDPRMRGVGAGMNL
jgi:peptide/nickel transport system permease protein